MELGHWILDNEGKIKKVDLLTWAKWFETMNRVVRQEYIGDYYVSTVFLGIDHNFSKTGPPILWETMVFNNYKNTKSKNWEEYSTRRCSGNKEQAEAMHEEIVKNVCELQNIEYHPERIKT